MIESDGLAILPGALLLVGVEAEVGVWWAFDVEEEEGASRGSFCRDEEESREEGLDNDTDGIEGGIATKERSRRRA